MKKIIKKSSLIYLALLAFFECAAVAQTITISQQPTNVATQPGLRATFSVVATSSPPAALSFQWSRNGAPIVNATNASTIRGAYNDGTRNLIVLEAEHFDKNTPGAGQSWTFTTAPPYLLSTATDTNFSGTGSMVQPNTLAGFTYNPGDRPTDNPQLDYAVYFPMAGDYHVWVRGSGDSDVGGVHDSVNLGLDGVLAYRINGVHPQAGGYVWGDAATPAGAVLSVPTAGLHVFNLWQREDGFAVDKIVITTDLTYTPTGIGPAESPLLAGAATSFYTTPVLNAGDLGTNLYSVRVSAGAPFVNSDTVSLVVTSSFVPSTFYSQAVFNDQPLAYWSFDEAGLTDNAKQQMDVPQGATTVNDLVAASTATRVAHGSIDSGLFLGNTADLDGAANFNTPIPNLGSSSLPGPYAIEFWMQHAAGDVAADYLICFDGSGIQAVYYGANNIELFIGGNRAPNGPSLNNADTNWHHVMWVFYGNLRTVDRLEAYLDGVRTANIVSLYNSALNLTGPITVGEYRPVGGLGFKGRMDEVAIYDLRRYTTEAQLGARVAGLVNDHRLASTVNGSGITVTITQQPADTSTAVGNTATFSVQAAASGTLAYQWQKNWVDIPGATSASYTTPATGANDAGASVFRARVSSGSVFVNSQEAILDVTGVTINFSQQPTNVTANVGGTATFSAAATSTPAGQLSYQWFKNGTKIVGATNASYTTPVLNSADVGTNFFKVQVSVGNIFVDSATAALTVLLPPPLPPTAYSLVVSNDLPLLYWNFDEGGGNVLQRMPLPTSPTTVNDLVPAFNATRAAHGSVGSGLVLGNAADLDGASNFNTPTPNLGSSSLPGPYAIEFWIQHAPNDVASDYLMCFDGGGVQAVYYNANNIELFIGGNRAPNGLSLNNADTNWHHVMWVFYSDLRAENKLDAYLDGIRTPNIVSEYNVGLKLAGPITVGDYRPLGGIGFKGRMDEVAIYDLNAFSDEASLTSYVDGLVARHRAAALPVLTTLSFSRAGSQLTLSWSGAGYTLQETSSLSPTVMWVDAPSGTNNPAIVTIGPANKFYRLSNP